MIARRAAWLLLVANAAACAPQQAATAAGAASAVRPPSPGALQPAVVESNILREDYVGTAACIRCHSRIGEGFLTSPMHGMTRHIDGAHIAARFDGEPFVFKGDRVVPFTSGTQRYMRVEPQASTPTTYLVTKVIGGRTREDFVGYEIDPTQVDTNTGEEAVLPISWLRFASQWRYKGYSVMVPDRPGIRRGATWRTTCILCHNTSPYLVNIYDELLGKAAPPYQSAVADKFMPDDRSARFVIDDEGGLARAVAAEIERVGGRVDARADVTATLRTAIKATRAGFDEGDLLEVGIGCESCHNGGRAHAADPAVTTSFLPLSPLMHVASVRRGGALALNRVCLRCHSVLFSRYPYTWEGGRRDDAAPHLAGASSMNSGEARDFLLGACSAELTCTSCHDVHNGDAPGALAALGTIAGNPRCTRCHEDKATPAALAAHSHHDPSGPGGACIACHMAKKNASLDMQLTRLHRIGSPTDEARVLGDRPLECALCHADKSVRALVGAMETFWGKTYDRAALRRLYGDDLDANAVRTTLERGKPHEQIVAAAVAGEARDDHALPGLVDGLAHPMPLVRAYMKASASRVAGAPVDVDLDGDVQQIVRAGRAWLSRNSDARNTDARPADAHDADARNTDARNTDARNTDARNTDLTPPKTAPQ